MYLFYPRRALLKTLHMIGERMQGIIPSRVPNEEHLAFTKFKGKKKHFIFLTLPLSEDIKNHARSLLNDKFYDFAYYPDANDVQNSQEPAFFSSQIHPDARATKLEYYLNLPEQRLAIKADAELTLT